MKVLIEGKNYWDIESFEDVFEGLPFIVSVHESRAGRLICFIHILLLVFVFWLLGLGNGNPSCLLFDENELRIYGDCGQENLILKIWVEIVDDSFTFFCLFRNLPFWWNCFDQKLCKLFIDFFHVDFRLFLKLDSKGISVSLLVELRVSLHLFVNEWGDCRFFF